MNLIFLLTLSISSIASEHYHKCDTVMSKDVTHFEFQDPRLIMKQHDTFFLGEGVWGVVKLISSDQTFKAIKNYKNQSQAAHDLKALQLLSRQFSSSKLKIIKSKLISPTTMELEYAPGRTLEDIYYDSKTSSALRSKLKEKYIAVLRELIPFFQSSEFIIDINHKELPRVSAQNDDYPPQGLHFIIKPDNIIVHPSTLELVLIDPS